jgi:DNA polymerase-4
MNRKILHLDLDAFFCAVEELRDPALSGIPFAVGGTPDQRGVVASCSYAARAYGVHSAMPMSQAVRVCSQLRIVEPDHKAYREMSRRVMACLREFTPLIEQLSIDEAFLDLTDHTDSPEALARRLQDTINNRFRLSVSLGVATNKLVAKIANNVGKATARGKSADLPPNAIQVVAPGKEADFLAPLPVEELWGVGPKTAERLHSMGIQTIGDVTRWSEATLATRFGKHGTELYSRCRGIDTRAIEVERPVKSVSKEVTFSRDVRDREQLRRTLHKLSIAVGKQLRAHNLRGNTIKLKLRWANFVTLTRQITLDTPTNQEIAIYTAGLELFDKAWSQGIAVRLIGIGVSGFDPVRRQLDLFVDAPRPENEHLKTTLDALRNKFGDQVVRRGGDLRPKN